MLTSSGRVGYQTSHCEKFGALRGPEADHSGARLCPQDQPQQDRMRGGVEPLQRASVCDGAAAGASPTVAVRPPERGWRHCKELTETPMLTPSGRGSYQISHCEKFGALRGPEADSAGGPTDGFYGRSQFGVLRTVTTRRCRRWRCGWGLAHSRARFEIRWREGQPHYGRKLLRGTHGRATGTVALPFCTAGRIVKS